MKVLVTGADGFIGSHLAENLVSKGFKVKCLVYYNSFNSWGWLDHLDKNILDQIEVVLGDIRDDSLMMKLTHKMDAVINLAALIGIPYSYDAAKSYFDVNAIGLINLLNASIKSKIKHFLHTSTSEVYGNQLKVKYLTENSFVDAHSPYAASKIAADQIALSFHRSYGIPVTIIRPFNTYGPRQSARAVIPTIISQLLDKKKKTVDIGNINSSRDFTYVTDTAEAFSKSLFNNKSVGKIINLGVGVDYKIKDIIKKLYNITNSDKKLLIDKNRIRPAKSEVNILRSNNFTAQKIINWRPKYGSPIGFDKGLRQTVNWFEKNMYLYKNKTNKYIY